MYKRQALGWLSGGLGASLVFALWGAAAAGSPGLAQLLNGLLRAGVCPQAQLDSAAAVVGQTTGMFLALFLGGSALGAAGGWLACPRQAPGPELFDFSAPQMALNVGISAVPASIVAAGLAAAIFSHLAHSSGGQIAGGAGGNLCFQAVMDLPLAAALLVLLMAHFALALVIVHEARQARHLCGLDEVKMGAFVAIGAAPALALLLLWVEAGLFFNPVVIAALLACAGLSLKALQTLLKLILPRRAALPAPQEGWQKTQASLFGTIASASGPQLVLLCAGCGLAMVLPVYACVLSAAINLAQLLAGPASGLVSRGPRGLFMLQAGVSTGLVCAAVLLLSAVYLFYLKLGRWYNRRRTDAYLK